MSSLARGSRAARLADGHRRRTRWSSPERPATSGRGGAASSSRARAKPSTLQSASHARSSSRRSHLGARRDRVPDRARAGPRTRSSIRLDIRSDTRQRPASGRRSSSSATAGRRRRRQRRFDIRDVQYWTTSRLRGRRRELRGQFGVRPSSIASASMGSGASWTSRTAINAARYLVATRQGRSRSPDHPWRQRRRLHGAGGADLSSGRVQGGSELLRHQRRRSARARHAQIRVALSRTRSIGPYPEDARALPRSDRRFTSSIGCRAR